MPWFDVIWTDENEAHLRANKVSPEEADMSSTIPWVTT